MLSMLLLGVSLFQTPREQFIRTVKSGAKNAPELGRQKAVLFFPATAPWPSPDRARIIFTWLFYFHDVPLFESLAQAS